MDPERETRAPSAPVPPDFVPAQGIDDLEYRALQCPCGGRVFRVMGWPRAVSGEGGFFWRSLTRVWREARDLAGEGEPLASAFPLPIETQCERCDRRASLPDEPAAQFGAPDAKHGAGPARLGRPREAYRCRDCRRGRVELAIGVACGASEGFDGRGVGEASDAREGSTRIVDVIARCARCRREARVASSDDRPSEQQRRLDVLYGRR